MKLWMKISQDRLALPEAVADTSAELARITGEPVNNIRSAIAHQSNRSGEDYRKKYIVVEVDD